MSDSPRAKPATLLPCCLTVAGSDSGGNAGIQADLRAFHAYGLHGLTAIAAVTAQNPGSIRGIWPLPAEAVAAQLDAVFAAYGVRAAKTGMLATAAAVAAVADCFARHRGIPLVVDPVAIATTGAELFDDAAIALLKNRLLPLATLATPNLPEARRLCGHDGAAADLARKLFEEYGCATAVKGGHATGATSIDILCRAGAHGESVIEEFALPRIVNPLSTHGTGCSFAAATAAELARGSTLSDAVQGAKRYVYEAIVNARKTTGAAATLGFVRMHPEGLP